jgi:hypothetical protein
MEIRLKNIVVDELDPQSAIFFSDFVRSARAEDDV